MTERRNRFYAVLTDSDGRVLALDGSLPTWETTGPLKWHDAGPVNEVLRRLVGVETVVLRPLRAGRDDAGRGVAAYEVAAREPPRGGTWLAPGGLALADPEQRSIVEQWSAGRGADDELRPPWTEPEWYDGTLAWVDEQLGALARSRTGRPVQLHAWGISSVMRIPTDAGAVYFKAVPPLFGHEPAFTRALDRRHPGRVPTVLSTDAERRWMLMEDLGGIALDEVEDKRTWDDAVRAYAGLQLDWVDDVGGLRGLGCPDRALVALEREIDETLADPMLMELPRGLAPEEVEGLPALAERLRAACDRLSALDVPTTLEHGDLHPGNVRVRDGGPAFYDWTDACVSIPFFSLGPFLERVEPSEAPRLRDAYLEPWAEHLSRERLADAVELARFLGLFHLAVSYRGIARATEERQRWQFGPAFPAYVRELLAHDG